MTLFSSSELACQKQRLNCHSSSLQLGSSFFPLFYDIFISGTPNSGLQARCEICYTFSLVYQHVNSTWGYFFQAEDGIRDAQESRGLGDVYKRQSLNLNGTDFKLNYILRFWSNKEKVELIRVQAYN